MRLVILERKDLSFSSSSDRTLASGSASGAAVTEIAPSSGISTLLFASSTATDGLSSGGAATSSETIRPSGGPSAAGLSTGLTTGATAGAGAAAGCFCGVGATDSAWKKIGAAPPDFQEKFIGE